MNSPPNPRSPIFQYRPKRCSINRTYPRLSAALGDDPDLRRRFTSAKSPSRAATDRRDTLSGRTMSNSILTTRVSRLAKTTNYNFLLSDSKEFHAIVHFRVIDTRSSFTCVPVHGIRKCCMYFRRKLCNDNKNSSII